MLSGEVWYTVVKSCIMRGNIWGVKCRKCKNGVTIQTILEPVLNNFLSAKKTNVMGCVTLSSLSNGVDEIKNVLPATGDVHKSHGHSN